MTGGLGAFIAGVAVFGGLVFGVSNYLHPAGSQQPMFPPGTVITIPPAPTTNPPVPVVNFATASILAFIIRVGRVLTSAQTVNNANSRWIG
jgi:hypothetical protein